MFGLLKPLRQGNLKNGLNPRMASHTFISNIKVFTWQVLGGRRQSCTVQLYQAFIDTFDSELTPTLSARSGLT